MLLCWLMKSFFIEKKIHYTGKTSCISWAKSHFDLEGDVVLASVGTSPRPKKTKKLASVSSRQPMLVLSVFIGGYSGGHPQRRIFSERGRALL